MNSFKLFLGTFKKINFNYVYVMLFDLLFWLVALMGYFFWKSLFMSKFSDAQASMTTIQSMTNPMQQYPLLQQHNAVINSFVQSSVVTTILLLAVIFAVWCIFRAYIWGVILNKEVTVKSIKRFFFLNLIWLPFNLILVVFTLAILGLIAIIIRNIVNLMYANGYNPVLLWLVNTIPGIFIVFPIAIGVASITNLIYIEFFKKHIIKETFKGMLETMFAKSWKIYLHFFYMGVVFLILSYAILPFRSFGNNVYMILSLIALIVFSTWVKYYLVDIAGTS